MPSGVFSPGNLFSQLCQEGMGDGIDSSQRIVFIADSNTGGTGNLANLVEQLPGAIAIVRGQATSHLRELSHDFRFLVAQDIGILQDGRDHAVIAQG